MKAFKLLNKNKRKFQGKFLSSNMKEIQGVILGEQDGYSNTGLKLPQSDQSSPHHPIPPLQDPS
jgi:hypothetical protein